ncbi:hypothetical protein [Euzebya sp.]|uniref:hypothetical protein n=1 Tax=Euzebya sp. TaxID=1971409 RepID=UPI003518C5CE
MLSSISPVGERGRGQRWAVTVTAYLAGSVVGGAAVGTLVGGVGALALSGLSEELRLALIAAVALVGVVADLTVGVPSLHRQVDERWLTGYRGWVYGGGYGLQLGTGLVTVIPSSVVWATWLGAALLADPRLGALVGLTFGLVRALPLLAAGRVRTVGALRRTLAWMDRVRPRVARAVPVLQGLAGAAALVAVVV